MNLLKSALIICTKDRASEISELLQTLKRFKDMPSVIVVVDSSADDATRSRVEQFQLATPLIYLHSLPGAAHQKNMGLEYLVQGSYADQISVVHFLDDDVRPKPDYFSTVLTKFELNPQAIVVGGFDETLKPESDSFLRKLFRLQDKRGSGFVLSSGICQVPLPTPTGDRAVDFVPGGMQSVLWSIAREHRFDGRVRIYGDEVEFQTRIQKFGDMLFSPDLPVMHKSATKSKDNSRLEQGYMDGFRWSLASKHPHRVRKTHVVWATIGLMIGELFRFTFIRRVESGERLLGHLDFFFRLALRKPVQQYVNHQGSGPFLESPRF
jgi:GT2 family glycosyltransferase